MIISEIIAYLEELKEEKGDVPLSMDFRENESSLKYDEKIECVFGDYPDTNDDNDNGWFK